MRRAGRDWLAWFLGIALVVAVAGMVNLARDVGQPFPGLIIWRNVPQGRWYFDEITPTWWPGALQADFEGQSEALIGLNGQPFGIEQRALFLQAEAAGQSQVVFDTDHWGVGAHLQRSAPLTHVTLGQVLDFRFPDLIVFVCLWLLAVLVYRVRPADPLNRIAAVLFCVIGEYRWLDHHTFFMDDAALTRLLGILCYSLYGPSIGAVMIHFGLHFPRRSRLLHPVTLLLNYLIVGVFMGGRFLAQVVWSWGTPWDWHAIDTAMLQGAAVYTGLGVLFVVLRMGWLVLQRHTEPAVTRQAGIFAVGLLIALPEIAILLEMAIWGGDSIMRYYVGGLDLRYLLIAVPMTAVYVILRYKAFRSSHPVFLVVLVIASSALLASSGAWLWLRAQDPIDPAQPPPFLPLFVVAACAGGFWSSQTAWKGALGRLFHWDRRSYREASAFGADIAGHTTLGALAQQVVQAIQRRLVVDRAALWLWDTGPDLSLAAASSRPEPALRLDDLPRSGVAAWTAPLRIRSEFAPTRAEHWRAALAVGGYEALVKLQMPMTPEPLGLLAIGKRADEDILDERDLEILELIAQQTSMMLLAVRQIEDLQRVPQRLADAQATERFRIAQDLHDTVQQRLGGVQPLLAAAQTLAHQDPMRTRELLDRSVSEIESAAQMISRIRLDLAPPLLSQTPALALRSLIDDYVARTGADVALAIEGDLERGLSVSQRQALYFIVQQALDNVAEHAGPVPVQVRFTVETQRLRFEVVDQGPGFGDQTRTRAQAHGSFGLTSMRARALSHGGDLLVTSEPTHGTRVSGWLPLTPNAAS